MVVENKSKIQDQSGINKHLFKSFVEILIKFRHPEQQQQQQQQQHSFLRSLTHYMLAIKKVSC